MVLFFYQVCCKTQTNYTSIYSRESRVPPPINITMQHTATANMAPDIWRNYIIPSCSYSLKMIELIRGVSKDVRALTDDMMIKMIEKRIVLGCSKCRFSGRDCHECEWQFEDECFRHPVEATATHMAKTVMSRWITRSFVLYAVEKEHGQYKNSASFCKAFLLSLVKKTVGGNANMHSPFQQCYRCIYAKSPWDIERLTNTAAVLTAGHSQQNVRKRHEPNARACKARDEWIGQTHSMLWKSYAVFSVNPKLCALTEKSLKGIIEHAVYNAVELRLRDEAYSATA